MTTAIRAAAPRRAEVRDPVLSFARLDDAAGADAQTVSLVRVDEEISSRPRASQFVGTLHAVLVWSISGINESGAHDAH